MNVKQEKIELKSPETNELGFDPAKKVQREWMSKSKTCNRTMQLFVVCLCLKCILFSLSIAYRTWPSIHFLFDFFSSENGFIFSLLFVYFASWFDLNFPLFAVVHFFPRCSCLSHLTHIATCKWFFCHFRLFFSVFRSACVSSSQLVLFSL